MVLIENDGFLTELTRMFKKSRNQGSVYITMKRYDGRTKPKPRPEKQPNPPPPPPSEFKCLFRAQLGGRKISTIVHAKDVNKFQLAYSNLLKGNIDGLKKKDRKKATTGSKSKATQ